MGEWSFNPTLEDGITTADTSGGLKITVTPKSRGYNITEYTVTYIADNGCKVVTGFTIDNECGDSGCKCGELSLSPSSIEFSQDSNTSKIVTIVDNNNCIESVTLNGDSVFNQYFTAVNNNKSVNVTLTETPLENISCELNVVCRIKDNDSDCSPLKLQVSYYGGGTSGCNSLEKYNVIELEATKGSSWASLINTTSSESVKCVVEGLDSSWLSCIWCTSSDYAICSAETHDWSDGKLIGNGTCESNGKQCLWVWANDDGINIVRTGTIKLYSGDDHCYDISLVQKANTDTCSCGSINMTSLELAYDSEEEKDVGWLLYNPSLCENVVLTDSDPSNPIKYMYVDDYGEKTEATLPVKYLYFYAEKNTTTSSIVKRLGVEVNNIPCGELVVTQLATECNCTAANIGNVRGNTIPNGGSTTLYPIAIFTANTEACLASSFKVERYNEEGNPNFISNLRVDTLQTPMYQVYGIVEKNQNVEPRSERLEIFTKNNDGEYSSCDVVFECTQQGSCDCSKIVGGTVTLEEDMEYFFDSAWIEFNPRLCDDLEIEENGSDKIAWTYVNSYGSEVEVEPPAKYIFFLAAVNMTGQDRTKTLTVTCGDTTKRIVAIQPSSCNCGSFNINGLTLNDGDAHSEYVPIATSSIGGECKNLALKHMVSDGPGTFIDVNSIAIDDSNGNLTAPIINNNTTNADIQQTIKIVPPGETDHCQAFTVTQPPMQAPCTSCSTRSEYGGVNANRYIPRTGYTSQNPLGTINNGQCSGNFTFEGSYNWIENPRISTNGEPRYLFGNVLENDATPNNRVATFTIKSASGVECGEIKVWQRGCDIEDIVSVYTESNPAENDGINPPREIGSFKKKKTCNVEFNLQPDKTWVRITDTTVSESGNYYVVHVFGRVLGNNESRSRTCNVNIRDNSDNFGLGIIEVYQSNI